jgi:hypothetical protein
LSRSCKRRTLRAAFDRFRNSLARYGLDVIGSWVRSEDIFMRCAARGVKGLPSSMLRLWSAQDLEEIVQDTVAQALVAFETDALRGAQVAPGRGSEPGHVLYRYLYICLRGHLPAPDRALAARPGG